jgi:hypothetical protein
LEGRTKTKPGGADSLDLQTVNVFKFSFTAYNWPVQEPAFSIAGNAMRMSYLCFRAPSSLVVAFTTLSLPAKAPQQSGTQSFQFMNPALPIDPRVNDLIGRMTLEEKVSQMRDHAPSIPRRDVPKYDWWNEGLTRRRFCRLCH